MIRRWRFGWFFACLVLFAETAAAHPHAWIDLRSRVLLNEDGEVHAFEFTWLFDDYYTVPVVPNSSATRTV